MNPLSATLRGPTPSAMLPSPAPPPGRTPPESPPSVDLAPLAALIERQGDEIRRLTEAATVWQVQAVRAEEQLKARTAGDDPSSAPLPVPPPEPIGEPRPATEALMMRWRRWFRRMTDG